MPIINPESYYYLDGEYSELRTGSGVINLGLGIDVYPDHQYWYIEFKRSLAKLSAHMPTEVINDIKLGDTHLILCNSHEAFHEVVNEIYLHVVIGMGIPEHKILLLSESADIHQEIYAVAKALNKKPIHAKWTRIFEHSCYVHMYCRRYNEVLAENVPALAFFKQNVLQDKPYTKKFLNFNRRWRLHRPTLTALLYSRNLLDKGHVSLAPCDDQNDWNKVWPWIMGSHTKEITDIVSANEVGIKNLPPMYLDTDELVINKARLEDTSEYLYEETYFSVVSETNYYSSQPGRFVSEKIFKPIVYRHPFMLVTRPNTLALMRELGYSTFSPFIDERYDLEEDDNKRMMMILNEIERLSNLSPAELTVFLDGVRNICRWNQQVLLAKTLFLTNLI